MASSAARGEERACTQGAPRTPQTTHPPPPRSPRSPAELPHSSSSFKSTRLFQSQCSRRPRSFVQSKTRARCRVP
eukprot:1776007-Rhodomonas_salina.1